jgi:glyoxalase family protein
MTHDTPNILGLHHITAIAGDPERNVLFYNRLLGLRLVKVTVNFDDPGSYHLYYGGGKGSPGSLLTFFPWPSAHSGSRSTGETSAIALSIPTGSLDFWKSRLNEKQVSFQELSSAPDPTKAPTRLAFSDPDGMNLHLVEAAGMDSTLRWDEGPVPPDFAIHGLHHVVLDIFASDVPASRHMLETNLGLNGNSHLAEIASAPSRKRGQMGPGVVHHIAWRAADDAAQAAWRTQLLQAGLHVTPVQDRQYFHSIYFREPGGVLYEIATDNPGFLTDESYAELGKHLKLPPWLEPHRKSIETALPPLPKEEK